MTEHEHCHHHLGSGVTIGMQSRSDVICCHCGCRGVATQVREPPEGHGPHAPDLFVRDEVEWNERSGAPEGTTITTTGLDIMRDPLPGAYTPIPIGLGLTTEVAPDPL